MPDDWRDLIWWCQFPFKCIIISGDRWRCYSFAGQPYIGALVKLIAKPSRKNNRRPLIRSAGSPNRCHGTKDNQPIKTGHRTNNLLFQLAKSWRYVFWKSNGPLRLLVSIRPGLFFGALKRNANSGRSSGPRYLFDLDGCSVEAPDFRLFFFPNSAAVPWLFCSTLARFQTQINAARRIKDLIL